MMANGAVGVIHKSKRLGLATIIGVSAGSAPLCSLMRRAFVAENLTKPIVELDAVHCSDVLTNEKNVETASSFLQLLLRLSNRQKLTLQILFKTVFYEVFRTYFTRFLEIGCFKQNLANYCFTNALIRSGNLKNADASLITLAVVGTTGNHTVWHEFE